MPYGIMVLHEQELVHYCSYQSPPLPSDFNHLVQELERHETIGQRQDLLFVEAPAEIVKLLGYIES